MSPDNMYLITYRLLIDMEPRQTETKMTIKRKLAGLLTTFTIIAAADLTGTAMAASNMLFILDASNSMWGQVDGTAKIETAKAVMGKLLSDLPDDTNVGLMVYGHRTEGDCSDVELMTGVGAKNAEVVKGQIAAITPRGKTPISASLQKSAGAFAGMAEENNNVVLISDGIETCEGDPCQTAEALTKAGVKVRVHAVGFNVNAAARQQLECIVRVGGGQYFNANSTQDFQSAISAVQKVAQTETKPEPAPPPPAPKQPVVYFEDQFDGEELGDAWEVVNPNPDGFIVENGLLSIIASEPDILQNQSGKLQNLFRLTKDFPKGDWTMTMRVIPGIATFREAYSLALYKDKSNFLSATVYPATNRSGHAWLSVYGNKMNKGTNTEFSSDDVYAKKGFGDYAFESNSKPIIEWANSAIKAIQLRIRKEGRSYFVATKVEGEPVEPGGEKPDWVELEKLTSLRPPGKSLAIFLWASKSLSPHIPRSRVVRRWPMWTG